MHGLAPIVCCTAAREMQSSRVRYIREVEEPHTARSISITEHIVKNPYTSLDRPACVYATCL